MAKGATKARRGVVFDAGAFIALERKDPAMFCLAKRLLDQSVPLVTSAGVVAQVWRSGSGHQVALARMLLTMQVEVIDHSVGRILGRLLGQTGTRDIVDAHVVWIAQTRGWRVLTSDPRDLLAIDASLEVVVV
jgi:predicted nucleic acid-binding protein